MMSLAESAIEEMLGVETSSTVWAKHLYELAGFKEILGAELVGQVVNGQGIADGYVIDMPRLAVRLRKREAYAPLSSLLPTFIGLDGTIIHLQLQSEEGDARLRLRLDLAQERLLFDISKDLYASDLGSANSANVVAELRRFSKDYYGNGQLEIYNAETEKLLARKDSFFPVNTWVDHQAADAEIAVWRRRASSRRQFETRPEEVVLHRSNDYNLKILVSLLPISNPTGAV